MLLEWLELVRLPGISIARKRALIEYYQTPNKVLQASVQSLKKSGIVSCSTKNPINRSCEEQATRDYLDLEKLSAKSPSWGFIPFNCPAFSISVKPDTGPAFGSVLYWKP